MFTNDSTQEAESKLLLLYILNKFDIPITNNQITEFIMEKELLNYFMLQQFLSELVDSSLVEYIENEDHYYYLITEKGKNTLKYFRSRLVDSLIQDIDTAVEKRKKIILKETEISATYTKKSKNNYIVQLKVVENNLDLIDLKLDVVSNKQAKQICEKWKNNAQDIYGEIINLLIN